MYVCRCVYISIRELVVLSVSGWHEGVIPWVLKNMPPSSKCPLLSLTSISYIGIFPLCKRPVVSVFWNIATVVAAEYIVSLCIVWWLSKKASWFSDPSELKLCSQSWKTLMGCIYSWEKLNIWVNPPSPLLPQSSMQKPGVGYHRAAEIVQDRKNS